MRRKRVVGQGLPVREEGHAQGGREEGHLIGQALGVRWVGADDGEQAFVARLGQGKLRQQEGVTRAQGFG